MGKFKVIVGGTKEELVNNMLVFNEQLGLGIVQQVNEEGTAEVSFIGYAPNVVIKTGVLTVVNFGDIYEDYQDLLEKAKMLGGD